MKKRVVSFIAALAIVAGVIGASAGIANSLITSQTSVGQAIACNTGGGSGGGC